VSWNKALDGGGFVVGDDVKIIINVEFVKKPPEAPKAEEKKADTQTGAGEKK